MAINIIPGFNGTPQINFTGDSNYVYGLGDFSGKGAVAVNNYQDKTIFDITNTSDEGEQLEFEQSEDSSVLSFHGENILAELGEGDNTVYWDAKDSILRTNKGDDYVYTTKNSENNFIELGYGNNTFYENGDKNLTTVKGKSEIYTGKESDGAVIIADDSNHKFDLKGSNAYIHAGAGHPQFFTHETFNVINVGDAKEMPENLWGTFEDYSRISHFLDVFFADNNPIDEYVLDF